jgi:mono/diheme cytochrome c family protein
MSDHSAHDPAPRKIELTNPLLWTVGLVAMALFLAWLFFVCMDIGSADVRGEQKVADYMVSAEPTPDFEALIADRGPATLAAGKQIFDTNCATCHGVNGDTKGATTQGARNFRADAFKNPNGGGPYALYVVVSNGFNGVMPSFSAGFKPAQRMAVVQYVREAFVKKYNQEHYVEQDPADVLASIPKPGSSAAGGAEALPPNQRAVPGMTYQLMAVAADQAASADAALATWAEAARDAAGDQPTRADAEALCDLVARAPGLGVELRASAAGAAQERFASLLTGGVEGGVDRAAFLVMSKERVAALYLCARTAAEGSR